jgi:hypothetical protein
MVSKMACPISLTWRSRARKVSRVGRRGDGISVTEREIMADLMKDQRVFPLIRGAPRIDATLAVVRNHAHGEPGDALDQHAVVIERSARAAPGAPVVEIGAVVDETRSRVVPCPFIVGA